jgi:hypothetical protein
MAVNIKVFEEMIGNEIFIFDILKKADLFLFYLIAKFGYKIRT